jgi:hypothetical protein
MATPLLPSVLHSLAALPWAGVLYMAIVGVVVLVALFAGEDRRQDALRVLALLLRRPETKPPVRRPATRRSEQKPNLPDGKCGPDR